MCGNARNGTIEFSEGNVWPSGLANYIKEHDVRLPAEFVRHAYAVASRSRAAMRVPRHARDAAHQCVWGKTRTSAVWPGAASLRSQV